MVGTPFEKGRSGNPSGRPKADARVRELAQAQTESAIAGLVRVLEHDKSPAAARVSAAVALLDRGWGKPVQSIEGEVLHEAGDSIAALMDAVNGRTRSK